MHAAMVDGTFGRPRGPFDLYDFVNDADRPALMERGLLPWWAHPQLTIRFFRPLSSAVRWADHKILGRSTIPLHLHSVAWWIAAIVAARTLFRRVLAPRALAIATAIFALSPAHALPLGWLANREVLLSLTFGALGLSAYVRWREGSRAKDALVSAALFALALLAGEYGLAFAGYVVAFELLGTKDTLARRILGSLAFFAPAIGYMAVRTALGYGTRASGFYSDPIHEPLEYLANAPWRLVVLLAQGWLTYTAEGGIGPWERWAIGAIVVLGIGLLVSPTRRALASLGDAQRASAKWLILGSILSLAPVLSVVPSARLLGAAMLGIAPLVAIILDRAWFPPVEEPRRGAAELMGLVATVLGFAHLVHAPVMSWLIARRHAVAAGEWAVHTTALGDRMRASGKTDVVVVRGLLGTFFAPFAMSERGAGPARWRPLSHTGHVLVLRRDEHTLELVVAADRSIFPIGPQNLFRAENAPVHEGEEFPLPGARATVLEIGASGPRRVRFTFDDDLDSPNVMWIGEGFDDWKDVELPRQGFGAPLDP